MAKWVSQSKKCSVSKSARTRVAYLTAVVPAVNRIVADYFKRRPDGEEVTLQVLETIGPDALAKFAVGDRDFDAVKQDVGRLVALCLVDTFGAHRVLTFREDDGHAVSTRAVRRAGMAWVSRYTPHRVLAVDDAERIVLDTQVARYVIQGGPTEHVLDLAALTELKGTRPVSLADAAWAEILEALLRPDGGIPFDRWRERVAALDAVLDPGLPILPGGRDLVALAGLLSQPRAATDAERASSAAVWKMTMAATSAASFSGVYEYECSDGQRFRIGPLADQRPLEELLARGRRWATFVTRIASQSPGITIDDAAAVMRANLATDLPAAALDRLDLLVRVVGLHAARANDVHVKHAVDENDAIDIDVLFSTVLPAVVCSADKALLRAAKTCGSGDGWRVMSPIELIDWLRRSSASGTA